MSNELLKTIMERVESAGGAAYVYDGMQPVISYGALRQILAVSLPDTHPKPVTPAGGEVEPVAWVNPQHLVNLHAVPQMSRTIMTTPLSADQAADRTVALYLHPPVADAALVRDAERYRWLRTPGKAQADVAYSFIGDEMDEAIDAALNQRGGV